MKEKRIAAIEELSDWIDESSNVIVFDTETNGFAPPKSVLSICAIKYSWHPEHILTEVDRFQRFYFSKEPPEPKAIEVNGLTEEVITSLRKDESYPKHFIDDDGFQLFCKDVLLFAGHNIDFDLRFVPFLKDIKKLDTMKANTNIVCLESEKGGYKWPKLKEAAIFYQIPIIDENLHSSAEDSEITAKILIEMIKKYKNI